MKLRKPEAEGNFVPTLNQMGYMVEELDPYSQAFVDFSEKHHPVLEIGASYGVAAHAALKKGAIVYANDLDSRHLDILYDHTPKNLRSKLHLVPGDLLKDLHFEKETFSAILCSRVLHFFNGEGVRLSLLKFFEWLKPKGKVFVVCETPYMKPYYTFVPLFEERRKRGDLWPGFIEDPTKYNKKRLQQIPPILNWMHPEVLERELKLASFEVERVGFIARPYFPEDTQGDGRESTGIIGVKASSF